MLQPDDATLMRFLLMKPRLPLTWSRNPQSPLAAQADSSVVAVVEPVDQAAVWATPHRLLNFESALSSLSMRRFRNCTLTLCSRCPGNGINQRLRKHCLQG